MRWVSQIIMYVHKNNWRNATVNPEMRSKHETKFPILTSFMSLYCSFWKRLIFNWNIKLTEPQSSGDIDNGNDNPKSIISVKANRKTIS